MKRKPDPISVAAKILCEADGEDPYKDLSSIDGVKVFVWKYYRDQAKNLLDAGYLIVDRWAKK